MCFSAQASFVAAAILVPVGAITIRKALQTNPAYLGFASFPLLFGIQQAFEGLVWLSFGGPHDAQSKWEAIAFLFIAYFVWPTLVPFSAWLTEENLGRRRWFAIVTGVGVVLGIILMAPILADPGSLNLTLVRGSILYDPKLLWTDPHAKTVFRIIYALIVCVPLLLASNPRVRVFGALITISVILGFLFVSYAFTSIWCFVAALISTYIVHLVSNLPKI